MAGGGDNAGRTCWAGIDVGGRRKGFHGAAVGRDGAIAGPQHFATPAEVVKWLRASTPSVVAVDSPRICAPEGERSRPSERDFASAGICGIRWTPEREAIRGKGYYEWVENGLELYELLRNAESQTGWQVIEVFPTASWTVWAKPSGTKRRAAWTSAALADLKLAGLPSRRLNQDDRDAIAAALTARAHHDGNTRAFGEIVVPSDGSSP